MLFLSYKFDLISTANKYALLFKTLFGVFLYLALFLNYSNAGILEKTEAQESKFQSQDLYRALTAEIYNKLGEDNLAVDYYYELSATNKDPAIAKRVTELAAATGQIAKALDGAKRWVVLKPNDLEANQYLTLLLLRNSYFNPAAKQLDKIRELIEESSEPTLASSISADIKSQKFLTDESLTFIGALLSSEAHHEKALTVFNLYLKEYASKKDRYYIYQKQQRLITAQLAMKAKKYRAVVNSLQGLDGLDDENFVDATVMHAKALHKLRQNDKAIKYLKTIQAHPKANDSHRLELIRLLILEKRKSTALPMLETLVVKHSKNFELLKSLIALQLDQSKLDDIQNNINTLKSNVKYKNEVSYFSGRFAEKLGQQEKALSNYENVVKGSYLKSAHKKRISLTKRIHGQESLKTFFNQQQSNAGSINDQAYWIKLEADDYFENKRHAQALFLYSKAISLAPSKTRYRYKRGLVNERLGNLDKAEADFNFVLAKQDNDADTLNALGYMLSVHTKRFEEAKTHIHKAYKLKPNDPLILDSLGFVLYKTGELNKAEKYLRKAYRLSKKPEVASHLIAVLAKLNQHQEAKSIYQQMQKIYPDSPSLQSVSHYIP